MEGHGLRVALREARPQGRVEGRQGCHGLMSGGVYLSLRDVSQKGEFICGLGGADMYVIRIFVSLDIIKVQTGRALPSSSAVIIDSRTGSLHIYTKSPRQHYYQPHNPTFGK